MLKISRLLEDLNNALQIMAFDTCVAITKQLKQEGLSVDWNLTEIMNVKEGKLGHSITLNYRCWKGTSGGRYIPSSWAEDGLRDSGFIRLGTISAEVRLFLVKMAD